MLELLAGVGVGLLAGSSHSSPDIRPALKENALATREAGRDISRALGGLAVATEATGHREVVHYRDVIWTTREGEVVRDVYDLLKLIRAIEQEPQWDFGRLWNDLNAYEGRSMNRVDPSKVLERHGRLFRFEVYHYWNVVVGLEVRRLAYRCLPDGMAREIDSNPENWGWDGDHDYP